MRLEHFKELDEDELGILNVIINHTEPKMVNYEIPVSLFPSIKHKSLMNRLLTAEKEIKEEHKEFYKQLLEKLSR